SSSWGEDKPRFRIDKLGDQPCRSHPVDLRPGTGQPSFSTVLPHIKRLKFRRSPGPLRTTEQHRRIMPTWTVEEINLTKLSKLFSQPLELGCGKFRIRFFPARNEALQRFS